MADSTTDVGVGYRLMEKDEPVLEGDEVEYGNGTWDKSGHYKKGWPQAESLRYRRKLPVPAPHATPDVCGWRTRANGEIIQAGDDVRKVVDGVVAYDWQSATHLIGMWAGTYGWQARYRIAEPVVEPKAMYRDLLPGEIIAEGDQYKIRHTEEWVTTGLAGVVIREDDSCPYRRLLIPPAPEPAMTTARWCGMDAAERREQQRPAIVAWLGGEKIEGLCSDEVWRDQDALTSCRPLRVKPEAPNLVWELGTDSRGNDLWLSKPDGYAIIQVLRNNVVHWNTNRDSYEYSSSENAKAACQRHCEREAAR